MLMPRVCMVSVSVAPSMGEEEWSRQSFTYNRYTHGKEWWWKKATNYYQLSDSNQTMITSRNRPLRMAAETFKNNFITSMNTSLQPQSSVGLLETIKFHLKYANFFFIT